MLDLALALPQNLRVVRWTTNVGRQVFSGITGQKECLSGTFNLTFKKETSARTEYCRLLLSRAYLRFAEFYFNKSISSGGLTDETRYSFCPAMPRKTLIHFPYPQILRKSLIFWSTHSRPTSVIRIASLRMNVGSSNNFNTAS